MHGEVLEAGRDQWEFGMGLGRHRTFWKCRMWQNMVRRLEASYIGEVIKGNKDKKCVDLAIHNSSMFIVPLVDGMGTQASQT